MRYIALVLLSVVPVFAQAQDYIKKRVVSEEGIPLSYSTISLKPKIEGVIANEDGFFSISKTRLREAETVIITHLGYRPLEFDPLELENHPLVILEKSVNELSEVNVMADNQKRWSETIYEAFEKRRNQGLSGSSIGQLTVRSYLEDRPVEILEGEGVVNIDKTGVPEDFNFAYVNSNIDSSGEIQFFSIHTTGLISKFSPFERLEVSAWPLHPGRLGKRRIRKDFKINLLEYNHETGISEFELISNQSEFLSARIWIAEDDDTVLRYEVFGENLEKLPIKSIIEGREIQDFSMKLTFDFGSGSSRLNYLIWNYSFNYGENHRIKTLVKLPIENGRIELPRFLHNRDYHDYAMAAILPAVSSEKDEEIARSRSLKDQQALAVLQSGSNALDVGLIFWDRRSAFDVTNIPENTEFREVSFDALADPSLIASLKEKFKLSFNSVIFKNSQGNYNYRTFFDKSNSAIPPISTVEVALLVNLIFDEHDYAAQRVTNSANEQNVNEITLSERDELQLRTDRLLINSRGGTDLIYLLERNISNYELHGIDRFHQLNKKALESPLFVGFNEHLNPDIPVDLALAYLLNGDHEKALNLLKPMKNIGAQVVYLKALIYYFSGDCEKFRLNLKEAIEGGFEIPLEAANLCL